MQANTGRSRGEHDDMGLSVDDVAALSRLLDEASELDPGQREVWLSSLPPEQAHLLEPLRAMLRDEHVTAAWPRLPMQAAAGSPAETGERIGPYRLVREIGRGGMGSVWLAERADGLFERQVALKLPRLAWLEGLADHLAREQRIIARLEHPHIARLYDAGVDDQDRPYIAMEWVDGQPIDAWCRERGLDTAARLRLFVQVIQAVAYAHAQGVVHCDLKPPNVLVDARGQVRLLDFGVARLMAESAAHDGMPPDRVRLLTPAYAAPEQVGGQPADAASDIYSLGVMLYELLTGSLPYGVKGHAATGDPGPAVTDEAPLASQRVTERSLRRALQGDVDAILAQAIHPQPSQRYAAVVAFGEDIERQLRGEPVRARAGGAGYRLGKAVRRHRVPVLAVSAVLGVLLVAGITAAVQSRLLNEAARDQQRAIEFVTQLFRTRQAASLTVGTQALHASREEMLRNGAALIAEKFADQPKLQAQLYGAIAEAMVEMGAGNEATEYAGRQLDTLQAIGAGEEELAMATLTLARGMRWRGRYADAATNAEQAASMAVDDATLRARALALRSDALYQLGRSDDALAALDRLQEALRLVPPPSVPEAWLYAVRADIAGAARRPEESSELFERAIATAQAADGEGSLALAEFRFRHAWRLLLDGQGDRAQTLLRRTMESLYARGGTAEVFAASEGAYHHVMRYEADLDSQAHLLAFFDETAPLMESEAVPESLRARWSLERGYFEARRGNLARARPLLTNSVPRVLASTDSYWQRARVGVAIAVTQAMSGRHDEVRRLFERLAQRRTQSVGPKHPSIIGFRLLIAINESMAGQGEAALAILDALPPLEYRFNGQDQATVVAWVRARVLADMGRYDEAAVHLRGREPAVEEQRVTRAEVLCATGTLDQGLAILEDVLTDRVRQRHPDDPRLAELRAKTGLCALAAGDRDTAARLATQARLAFTHQPDVSPYYRLPLQRLERQLAEPVSQVPPVRANPKAVAYGSPAR